MVQISGLRKSYHRFEVLKGVDLDVMAGERIVICGASGSGKSTFIRCINRMEDYQAGTILVNGMDPAGGESVARRIRRDVGMVFQQFNLFPHLTALENCTLAPRRVRGLSGKDANERAMHFLTRVRIADQAGKFPAQMSGGQQQRVAIARALCMEPKVMLFDEPTSALDPEMVGEVLDTMIELANDRITMICVTHEMGFARRVADRVAFMDQGRIVEIAPPDAFFGQAKDPNLRTFLSRILTH